MHFLIALMLGTNRPCASRMTASTSKLCVITLRVFMMRTTSACRNKSNYEKYSQSVSRTILHPFGCVGPKYLEQHLAVHIDLF